MRDGASTNSSKGDQAARESAAETRKEIMAGDMHRSKSSTPAKPGERGQRRPAGGGGGFRRRRVCKFKSEKIDYIDYKDVRLLMQFVPERGKIQPRRLSGTSAKWQRKLQVALKRARELALIPYATD
jgi:small subunit ribosomal protein S18